MADLRSRENDVRAERPEAVHDFRVACRRLRSALSGLEPLLDGRTCRTLADDLQRTARAIGPAQDAHVVRRHVDATFLADEDALAARLHGRLALLLEQSESDGWRRAVEYLDRSEYDDLTRSLERFADLPPWLTAAHLPADEVLRPLLRTEWSRFRRRARAALGDSDGETTDERLHEVRKASKRARYVAESTTTVLGRSAKRLARTAQAVQEALGEHQDLILTRTFLTGAHLRLSLEGEEDLAMAAIRDEQARALAAGEKEIRQLLRGADRKSLLAWMR